VFSVPTYIIYRLPDFTLIDDNDDDDDDDDDDNACAPSLTAKSA